MIFHCLKLSINTLSELSISFDSLSVLGRIEEIKQEIEALLNCSALFVLQNSVCFMTFFSLSSENYGKTDIVLPSQINTWICKHTGKSQLSNRKCWMLL